MASDTLLIPLVHVLFNAVPYCFKIIKQSFPNLEESFGLRELVPVALMRNDHLNGLLDSTL